MFCKKLFFVLLFFMKINILPADSSDDVPQDVLVEETIKDDNINTITVNIYIKDVPISTDYDEKSYGNIKWFQVGNKKKNIDDDNCFLSYEEVLKKIDIIVKNDYESFSQYYILEGYSINEQTKRTLVNMKRPDILKFCTKNFEQEDKNKGIKTLNFYFIKCRRKILFYNKSKIDLSDETKIANIKLNLDECLWEEDLSYSILFQLINNYFPYFENINNLYYRKFKDDKKSEFTLLKLLTDENLEEKSEYGVYTVEINNDEKLKIKKKYCSRDKSKKKKKKSCSAKNERSFFEILKIKISDNKESIK